MSDERVKKPAGDDKLSRAMTDRAVTENRELSDAERLEMLLASLQQSHLPNLPEIPGYHVCWLTTINPRDSIPQRLRMGYELIRAEELGPAYEKESMKTGEYAGHIMINEMVAAKLPDFLYQGLMREFHHTRPNNEQAKMNRAAELIKAQAEERGLKVLEGEAAERWS
jgi:hypothetical protein